VSAVVSPLVEGGLPPRQSPVDPFSQTCVAGACAAAVLASKAPAGGALRAVRALPDRGAALTAFLEETGAAPSAAHRGDASTAEELLAHVGALDGPEPAVVRWLARRTPLLDTKPQLSSDPNEPWVRLVPRPAGEGGVKLCCLPGIPANLSLKFATDVDASAIKAAARTGGKVTLLADWAHGMEWSDGAGLPAACSQIAAVSHPDGGIYLFGGVAGGDAANGMTQAFRLDPATGVVGRARLCWARCAHPDLRAFCSTRCSSRCRQPPGAARPC
jgi:hypothetical protein